MTDAQLVEMLLARDPHALYQIQPLFEKYCLTVARNILHSDQEAEQVVNDVWLRLWDSVPPAKPENLRLYLAKLTRNLALNRLEYLQAQKRSAPCAQLDELAEAIPGSLSAMEPEQQALKAALERFLAGLSREQRQVFLRRYWFGDSVEEIARRFGCSRTRISGILFRLRKQLKKTLDKEELSI